MDEVCPERRIIVSDRVIFFFLFERVCPIWQSVWKKKSSDLSNVYDVE